MKKYLVTLYRIGEIRPCWYGWFKTENDASTCIREHSTCGMVGNIFVSE